MGPRPAQYQPVENGEYEVLENEGFDSYSDAATAARGGSSRNIHTEHRSSRSSAIMSNRGRGSIPSDHGAPMMRTVSREGSAPLSHPTPDLQSLQGAYIGNVERLEQSAERMSVNSNLEQEISNLKLEQKRSGSRQSSIQATSRHFSTTSFSNSIRSINRVARSGGFSPEGYVASPVGSFMLPPWSSHHSVHDSNSPIAQDYFPRSEPENEGLPLDSPMSTKPRPLTVRNPTSPDEDLASKNAAEHGAAEDNVLDAPKRAASAASGDTFQRADKEFEDFDGVHINLGHRQPEQRDEGEPHVEEPPAEMRRASEVRESMRLSQENMVYYPAPVPMMLNLPQRLSKAPPASKLAQKKNEVLQAAMANNRRSAPMLSTLNLADEASNHPSEASKHASELPPQLRATMFFDHQPLNHNVDVRNGSAVATLDSILDASAFAPVSAFTDHPIAGQLGSEVYGGTSSVGGKKGKKVHRRTQSSTQLLGGRKNPERISDPPKQRISMVTEENGPDEAQGEPPMSNDAELDLAGARVDESMPLRSVEDDDAGDIDTPDEGEEDEDFEEPTEDAFAGRPTTLLAELQLRKTQQKQRNRTAATAFPNGMHSTLLEMDAVAHVQKQARRQKHVTLAWEDGDAVHPQDEGIDEDVPLGILYPGKAAQKLNDQIDEDRPLGLLAQRAMEDQEPLSRRRARLIGGPAAVRSLDEAKRVSAMDLRATTPQQANDEEEGETLAQRKQRLLNQRRIDQPRPVSGDFASEMLTQLGSTKETPAAAADAPSKTPEPEETLGQRRKRLLAEKEARERQGPSSRAPAPTVRRSMADLLAANPVGARTSSAGTVPGIAPSGLVGGMNNYRTSVYATPNAASNGQAGYDGQKAYGDLTGQGAVMQNGMHQGYINPMTYTPMTGLQGMAAGAPLSIPEPAPMADLLDPRQRAMIDRWRQDVV